MTYSVNDIQAQVSRNAYAAGRDYFRSGDVVACRVAGNRVLSKVQGSERRPYEQTITITREAGRALIDGVCSCPVGFNCKHVVAALLQARNMGPMPAAVPSAEAAAEKRLARLLPQPAQATLFEPPAALGSELMGWLDDLDHARIIADEDYPPTVNQRLIYVLSAMPRHGRTAQLGVTPMSVRLLKGGEFAAGAKPYAPQSMHAPTPAKFLRPSDFAILRDLSLIGYGTGTLPLSGPSGAATLAAVVKTGRARWGTTQGTVIAEGPPRRGHFRWELGDDAAVRPVLEGGPGLLVLNATPPVYVELETGLIGTIESDYAPNIAAALLNAPRVPAGTVAELNAALARRVPDMPELRPPEPAPAEVIRAAPVPMLHLHGISMPKPRPPGSYGHYAEVEQVGLARTSFRYGSVDIAPSESRDPITRVRDGRLIEIVRDRAAERRHVRDLLDRGLVPASDHRLGVPEASRYDLEAEGDELAWLDFLYNDLPQLQAAGWQVTIADDFPFRLLRADGAIDAELRDGSGIDWFELELGVVVDGQRVDLVGPICALIAAPAFDPAALSAAVEDESDPIFLNLGDGRMLALSAARLAPIVAAIQELALGTAAGSDRLRLTRADAAALAEFEAATGAAGLVWRGGERLRDMGRKLTAAGGIPPAVLPDTFRATLRPYQAAGVAWLAFLRDAELGGCLADDMGLGKTVQALALIAIEKAAGRLDRPVLVVAPTSLMANWRIEAERFTPDLRVLTLQGLDRKKHFGRIAEHDLVLTTYPLIARDHAVLAAQPWHLMILDEAQTIKNPDATTTKLIAGLEARHRFCLTGTPLENHLGELWSLFSFALPGFLGDRQSFTRAWRTPIEKNGDAARGRLLAQRIRPFLLRRTKAEVANDLPPKTEIVERIELQPGQRDIYESIRLTMHKKVRDAIAEKGFARSRIVILDALLKLRQACCDPRLLKLTGKANAKAGSAKLERLEEMLAELMTEDRRILVFSQFTSMLELIRPRLDEQGIRYSLLTGDTRDRETEVRQFQGGTRPVFLVSLKAGGVGLNLTAADTVILYDPWWNPAVEEQAIDRAHRIGQDKPVFVHKLVASGTIEEKMEVLKAKKRALAESLFDHDGAPTLAMTETDLEMLFAA